MPTVEEKSRKTFKRVSSLSLTHPPSSNGSVTTPTSSRPAPAEQGPTTSRAHTPHAFEAWLLPSGVPRTVPSTMGASSAQSKFALAASRLTRFDQKLSAPDASTPARSLSQVHREQLRSLWAKVDAEFAACSVTMAEEDPEGVADVQEMYDDCYAVYSQCLAELNDQLEPPTVPHTPQLAVQVPTPGGCHLPPCDTEVFSGDYQQWPTFRDLFNAIYIENPRLAPEEKLFHLNKKTSGEAHDIVAQAPLTNEGFASAWNALRDRFQNKRLILKAQLKILFSLPQIRTESAAALKELHRAVHKCLTTLTHSEVSTDSVFADGVLVYLISAKLPKTTLELWQQSTQRSQSYIYQNHCANTSSSEAQPNIQSYFASGTSAVLLGTAIVNICHLGKTFHARALIDSGSEATFITERLVDMIKLPLQRIPAQVSGLNNAVSAQSKKLCSFSIRSPTKPGLQLNATAYVIPELAANIPSHPISQGFLRDLPNLSWADPTFYESSQIDVLIGADILPSIQLSGSLTNICGSLLGQETIFGWVLTGPVPQRDSELSLSTSIAGTAWLTNTPARTATRYSTYPRLVVQPAQPREHRRHLNQTMPNAALVVQPAQPRLYRRHLHRLTTNDTIVSPRAAPS
ncbi:GL13155 [Drosophila persimilis]|uniref:GL13155 n=1 Tax=Drosophila persimilis TaxID=7234 RepID=B4IQV7_DROPE|nr:GL13155 [Drosophila persimilis]